MSTQREEVALRRLLEERRPLAIPPELSARLDRIPLEVKQRPTAPKRIVLAIAPWAGLVAAGLILAFGPLLVTPLALDPGTAPAVPWDPVASAPAYNDVGIFGLPWVPALVLVGTLGLAWTAWRLATRRPLRLTRPRLGVGRLTTEDRLAVLAIGAPAVLVAIVLAASLPDGQGPLEIMGAGPGEGFTEMGTGTGVYTYEGGEAVAVGDHIYRVKPGAVVTQVVTLRNTGAVPVRFLGIDHAFGLSAIDGTASAGWTFIGLGLPRDPSRPTGLLADSSAFVPVEVPAGGDVTLVAAFLSSACADPTAPLGGAPPSSFALYVSGTYELFGWRQSADLEWPVDITIPQAPGCVAEP